MALSIPDCEDGWLDPVRGGAVLRTAGEDVPGGRLTSLAAGTDIPGGKIFVRTDGVSGSLLSYLDALPAEALGELTLVAVDPETIDEAYRTGDLQRALVTDPAVLQQVADRYGAAVHVPRTAASALGEDAIALRPLDSTGTVVEPEDATGFRLEPGPYAAARHALEQVVDREPGHDLARSWVDAAERAAPRSLPWRPGDSTTYAIGFHAARYGSDPDRLAEVLNSTAAPTPADVQRVIGGEFGEANADALADAVKSNPGSSALIHGGGKLFWLTSAPDGTLTWVDPTETGLSDRTVVIDGAVDRRALILERPGTQVLLVGPDGAPVPLPAPPPATTTPSTLQIAWPQYVKADGDAILVGPWGRARDSVLGLLHDAGQPVIGVDVRREADSAGRWTMRPSDVVTLESVLQRVSWSGYPPVLLTIEMNDQIRDLAERYSATVVHPGGGIDGGWQVRTPDGATRPFTTMADTVALAPAVQPLQSDTLRRFLSQNSWPEAAGFLSEHPELWTDPAVADELARLVPSDRTGRVAALAVVTRLAAEAGGLHTGEAPLMPQAQLFTQTEPPLTRALDARFALDYLSGRPLPAPPGAPAASAFQTRMLWDSLLVRAMLDGKIAPDHAVALFRAVGHSDAEMAARAQQPVERTAPPVDGRRPQPTEAERRQGHVAVFEAVASIVGPASGGRAADVLSLQWCLEGIDRLPWFMRLRDMVRPFLTTRTTSSPQRRDAALGEVATLQRIFLKC